jgi:hypothetical protein
MCPTNLSTNALVKAIWAVAGMKNMKHVKWAVKCCIGSEKKIYRNRQAYYNVCSAAADKTDVCPIQNANNFPRPDLP